MTPYEAIEKLVSHLEIEIQGRKDAISNNAVASWEEYKHLCGVVRGMSLALDEIKRHASQME